MTGTHLEIVSHNVLWYKHSFRMDCSYYWDVFSLSDPRCSCHH